MRLQALQREFAALAIDAFPAALQDHWLWPTVPHGMGVTYRVRADDRVLLAGKPLTSDETFQHFNSSRDRLHASGVDNVWMQTITE